MYKNKTIPSDYAKLEHLKVEHVALVWIIILRFLDLFRLRCQIYIYKHSKYITRIYSSKVRLTQLLSCYTLQEQSSEIALFKSCFEISCMIYRKLTTIEPFFGKARPKSATILKKDSTSVVSLRVLINFSEQPFCRRPFEWFNLALFFIHVVWKNSYFGDADGLDKQVASFY